MKKILLAGSALAAALSFVSAANAADVGAPPAYDWTGFYFGANAGVAWNNSSLDNNAYADGVRYDQLANKIDSNQTAFTGGGMLGYNYQIEQIVIGAEADFNYLGFSDSNKRSASWEGVLNPYDTLNVTSKSSIETNWFGTIRGRLGYAIDNVLIYGTGGLAYGNVSANAKVNATYDPGISAPNLLTDSWSGSQDQTNWGWTVGGGMEYGIDKWSIGAEYLYVDLGSADWNNGHSTIDNHFGEIKGSADYAFSVVRATVKYRF